jgi:NitT/TauT family transport system ATP-binding protein
MRVTADDRRLDLTGDPPIDEVSPVSVSLREVTKGFGRGANSVVALDRVSLDVAPHEFVCLVGASGCGKTTLLNLISGLDTPSGGVIETGGQRVALMFQEAALFPWLTAAGNIELSLQLRGVSAKRERRQLAADLLDRVHLGGMGAKRPHELSGGMRQRVALARALAQEADLLLMDEPFGALDAMTRDLLHDELERIWSGSELTVVFVTHNVREAARLADRIVLLTSRPGRVAETFTVNLPRPRRIESPEVSSLAASITDRLREEVRRHGR